MEFIEEFINTYGITLLSTVLTAIFSYIGLRLKKLYEEKINTDTKEKVVKTVCEAVEQLYKDLSGEEKLDEAILNASVMLEEKGIKITELELRMLIEATINSFNSGLKG